MNTKLQKWLYGLAGGCIGGGAGAAVTWLGMAGAKSAGLDVPSLNLKAIGIIFLSGVISNGLLYLKQSPLPQMGGDTDTISKESISRLLIASALLPILCSCAFLSSTTYDPGSGAVTTRAKAMTFFDSQSALVKFQNRAVTTRSNEWAPGTSIGSLNQAASGTNFNDLVGTVVGAAVKAAAKP